jgi:hypothetical protein
MNISLTNVSKQNDSAKVIQLLFTFFSFCSIITSSMWFKIEIKRNNMNRRLTTVISLRKLFLFFPIINSFVCRSIEIESNAI